MLNALAAALNPGKDPTPSTHRLRRGLPGYLILFAPHAFAPQRQFSSRKSPSPPVFFLISTHFTATLGIPLSSPILQLPSFLPITGLSPALLRGTWEAACARFTPNNSGQRLPPTYYRGCWHVVSRGFLIKYRHSATISCSRRSSFITEVYNPKTFFLHAALLGQGFPHCRKFPTAASRRSLGRVSVPVWPVTLSGRLRIVALVGRYPANQLMRHKSILYQCFEALLIRSPCSVRTYAVLAIVSNSYPPV